MYKKIAIRWLRQICWKALYCCTTSNSSDCKLWRCSASPRMRTLKDNEKLHNWPRTHNSGHTRLCDIVRDRSGGLKMTSMRSAILVPRMLGIPVCVFRIPILAFRSVFRFFCQKTEWMWNILSSQDDVLVVNIRKAAANYSSWSPQIIPSNLRDPEKNKIRKDDSPPGADANFRPTSHESLIFLNFGLLFLSHWHSIGVALLIYFRVA